MIAISNQKLFESYDHLNVHLND